MICITVRTHLTHSTNLNKKPNILVLGMCSCCVVFFRTEFKKCRGVDDGGDDDGDDGNSFPTCYVHPNEQTFFIFTARI